MNSLKVKFGKRLRELRKEAGITQEQLAEIVNIEPPNISKIECGMHFPQPEKIERLAKALNVDIFDLFEFEHFNEKKDLVNYIISSIKEFDSKKLQLVYKFVYNLKLFK